MFCGCFVPCVVLGTTPNFARASDKADGDERQQQQRQQQVLRDRRDRRPHRYPHPERTPLRRDKFVAQCPSCFAFVTAEAGNIISGPPVYTHLARAVLVWSSQPRQCR